MDWIGGRRSGRPENVLQWMKTNVFAYDLLSELHPDVSGDPRRSCVAVFESKQELDLFSFDLDIKLALLWSPTQRTNAHWHTFYTYEIFTSLCRDARIEKKKSLIFFVSYPWTNTTVTLSPHRITCSGANETQRTLNLRQHCDLS